MLKIAIIGGGAAGCFAAANIPALPGREVVLFEKTGKLLQKVKVSGGGRCNVTHSYTGLPELLQAYPRGIALLRKTMHRFTPLHTQRWFENEGVVLKEEPDGRMFPTTDTSQTIIDTLLNCMTRNRTQVFLHHALTDMKLLPDNTFELHFSNGVVYHAHKVLIATGGYSKPDQYNIFTGLGHKFSLPVPSLFTFNMPNEAITALPGLSASEAMVKVLGTKLSVTGAVLITHWGMSGPAILKLSAMAARTLAECNYQFQIGVQWSPLTNRGAVFQQLRQEQGKQAVWQLQAAQLPRRLWQHLCQKSGISQDCRLGDLPAAQQNRLLALLTQDVYTVSGKTTYKEEFVTCGGININEISPTDMQSKIVKNLYWAGEIIDADGITGGYNFQHAWSSAWIAARAINEG